jgi:hypothetical protein
MRIWQREPLRNEFDSYSLIVKAFNEFSEMKRVQLGTEVNFELLALPPRTALAF